MRIQIITRDNGWGLTRDVRVLKHAVLKARPDAVVEFTDWRSPTPSARFDVNVFLELVNQQFFGQAPRNVLVPNPEWFMLEWLPLLERGITEVWAKTQDARRTFSHHHGNVKFVGWTSDDQMAEGVTREKVLVHLAGASSAKGTEEVIAAMRLLPQFHLTLVSKKAWRDLPENITHHMELDPPTFRKLQNVAMIHLCPSSYEGFGHYINEARSVRAVIISTNAAPMSELVHVSYGAAASVKSVSNQNLAQHKHVDPDSLAAVITAVMKCNPETLAGLGKKARAAYLGDRATFESHIAQALA